MADHHDDIPLLRSQKEHKPQRNAHEQFGESKRLREIWQKRLGKTEKAKVRKMNNNKITV